jgi:SAM-dependent methyltransferase
MGAEVVAFDFAENRIARARARPHPQSERIQFLVLDATDEAALLDLGERRFDAAICNMALFDMAELSPLMRALARLLRPGGRFVFSMLHPCFNSSRQAFVAEQQELESGIVTTHAVKVFGYLQSHARPGWACHDQPKPRPLYHRPLHELFGACFAAGMGLDGLKEPAFAADHPPRQDPLSWGGNLSEIPPVLVARMRLP